MIYSQFIINILRGHRSRKHNSGLENTIQNERDQKTIFEKHVFG